MVYICVLNYNNSRDTISCLDSLLKLDYDEYKIVLVDNASTDESYDVLYKYTVGKEIIKFFPLKYNNGYAAGNNVALRYSMSQDDMDYCWILNNDTIVEPDSLTWLIKYMEDNGQVGLCGSKLIYSWDKSRIQGYGGGYKAWLGMPNVIRDEQSIIKIDYVIGAAVFVRKNFLKEVGLMCEDYFLYYEELDWALRARGKFEIACEPRSVVYHREGAVVGANAQNPREKSELADYFSMRNRLLITKKFFPQYLLTVYLSSLVMLWNRFCRGQYRRIWMFIKLLFGIYDERFEVSKR